MAYLGSWKIDDLITLVANTHNVSTGAAQDADSVPTYRIYEDETATPILTGSYALIDSTNTVGFYSEQITASAANGFEKGKSYSVYTTATVNSVVGTKGDTFQIEAEVDANTVSGTVTPASGSITAAVIATGAIDADALATDTITAAKIAADAITAAKIADGAIDAATFAAGAINAAAIATGAIDADAIALDAANEIMGAVSGTADSGSTTTVVDTERTEADTDYWKGAIITFTNGTLAGQSRLVTAFDAAADTITFAPATTVAVGTHTYRLLPHGRVDVHFWLGAVVNALISGRVDANAQVVGDKTGYSLTQSFPANFASLVITAGGIVDADVETVKGTVIGSLISGRIDANAQVVGTGAIVAGSFGAGAIDAAAIATGAIDADALASDAIDEIWDEAMTELSSVPGVTASLRDALRWLFLLSRNKITQTATTQLLRNDADSATVGTSTLSDDATTFTRGEFS